MLIEDLFTKDLANKPTKLAIIDVNKEKTGFFFDVITIHSEAFQKAITNFYKDGDKDWSYTNDAHVIASLVSGWDLKTPFNYENCVKLLENAPYLTTYIFHNAFDLSQKVFAKKKPTLKKTRAKQSSKQKSESQV